MKLSISDIYSSWNVHFWRWSRSPVILGDPNHASKLVEFYVWSSWYSSLAWALKTLKTRKSTSDLLKKPSKKYQLKRLPKMSRIHRETADLQRFYDYHQNEGFETHFLPPPNPEQWDEEPREAGRRKSMESYIWCGKKKSPKIRICSDCSENLHTVKTIIITTPKTFLGVGGFSTYFFGHIHFWSLFHLKVNQPKPNINSNLY